MGNFKQVESIRSRLEDLRTEDNLARVLQGDPVRLLGPGIQMDVFRRFERGDRIGALVRFTTYVDIVLWNMIQWKCPELLKKESCCEDAAWPPERVPGGWVFSSEALARLTSGRILSLCTECFGSEMPSQLVEDLRFAIYLRNVYAHGVYPPETAIPLKPEDFLAILEGLKKTWQDLVDEYYRTKASEGLCR